MQECTFYSQRGNAADAAAFALLGGRLDAASCTFARNLRCQCDPGSIGRGTFVEIGARDGLGGSNSLFFERHAGWSGFCVEAKRQHFEKLRRNRPACWTYFGTVTNALPHGANATFVRSRTPPPANSGWSFFRRGSVPQEEWNKIKSRGRRLRDVREVMKILHFSNLFRGRRVRTVDFASVDVEGAEEAVLRTINFRSVAVRVLVVERPTVAVRALLRDAGMAAVGEYSSALGDIIFARNDLLAALSDDERARRLALVRRLATPFDAARAH